MTTVLIGAGGHAKVAYEIAKQSNINIDGFIDPKVLSFNELKKYDDENFFDFYFLGVGGVTVSQLENRNLLYKNYKKKSCPLTLLSTHAFVSESSVLGAGTLVSHNVVIQSGATIGENVIINTGSIVEHDAVIGDGAHIGPGAIILGGAQVGCETMIGAGAVILPGQIVDAKTLVPSLTRYRND